MSSCSKTTVIFVSIIQMLGGKKMVPGKFTLGRPKMVALQITQTIWAKV